MPPFQVIPVIDLMDGIAVHAAGGNRLNYKRLHSVFSTTAQPQSVAIGLIEALNSDTVYVADLDAIRGSGSQYQTILRMSAAGCILWVDIGVRSAECLMPYPPHPKLNWVLGLETLRSPEDLERITHNRSDELVFSLDMKNRIAMGESRVWGPPAEIASTVLACGISRLILLDLDRVGTAHGHGACECLDIILKRTPSMKVYIGGGISNARDLVQVRDRGAAGSLVGTAIHHGMINKAEIDAVTRI